MIYELGSRQGRLNRNELARLRQIAAARLREEYPWMTYEQIARDVGYSAGSSVRNALRRIEDMKWVEGFGPFKSIAAEVK